MTAPTLTLDATGPQSCYECQQATATGLRTLTRVAMWTLTTERGEFRLCSCHASAASFHFGIVQRTLNPMGQKTT